MKEIESKHKKETEEILDEMVAIQRQKMYIHFYLV